MRSKKFPFTAATIVALAGLIGGGTAAEAQVRRLLPTAPISMGLPQKLKVGKHKGITTTGVPTTTTVPPTTTTVPATSTTVPPTTTTVPPTTTTQPPSPPVPTINFTAVDQLGHPKPPTSAAQAVIEAKAFNLISASVSQAQAFAPYWAAMKQANPNLVGIVYVDGSHIHDATLPENYYAHTATGARIVNPLWNTYEMDMTPGGPWEVYYDGLVKAAIAKTAWDGIFDDSEGSGACAGSPVHPGTANVWTLTECLTATNQDARTAQTAAGPGKVLLANGLASGAAFVSAHSSMLLPGIYGGDAEEFPSVGSLTAWKNNLVMLATPGSVIMTNTKCLSPSPQCSSLDQWHRFSLATFALGTNGIDVYYFEGSSATDSNQPDIYTAQAQALGAASGAAVALPAGAFSRNYTNGIVVANPTSATVTVTFPQPMTNLDGLTVTSEVLAPQSGDLLHF